MPFTCPECGSQETLSVETVIVTYRVDGLEPDGSLHYTAAGGEASWDTSEPLREADGGFKLQCVRCCRQFSSAGA